MLITGIVFLSFAVFRKDVVFFLIPVFGSLLVGQPLGYQFSKLSKTTPIYLLLAICLTFIFYGAITEGVLLIQERPPTVSHVLLITNALAWAIMFEPARLYVQLLLERRFNVRNREAIEAVRTFTATLREEIDLDQLRERFLTVIQQTMQSYSVSLWVRVSTAEQEASTSVQEVEIAHDDSLITYMLDHPGNLKLDDMRLDSPMLQELKRVAAEIILPLPNQGELLGLLILGPHLHGGAYTREERGILDTLAPQVAPALRVAQLVRTQQEQVRKHERIEQELRTAQAIQQAFLPKDVPSLLGWQLIPYYRPAREVGGDFYDFLLLADGHLGIIIGDVTDKGVPAALVMATTHTLLRSAMQTTSSPAEVLAQVNDLLYAEIPSGMFVTCFYALLDPVSGQLRYANAGHELPYRHGNGNATELWATGMPLGMMPGTRYEEQEVMLSSGESLLFYSDGLVEAHDARREMFGFPRLKALLEEHANETALIDILLGELKRFTGEGWEQEDDVTLLTLHKAISS